MNITNEQKQLMLSGLLGDGSVKHSHIAYNCMYKEYMDYKRQISGNLTKSEVRESNNLGFKKGSKIYSFSMKLNDYSKYLASAPLSKTIKDLDELGLALWFMDDGSVHKKNYFYNLNTHSFSKEEQENILIPKLNEFGIYPKVLPETKKDGRVFYYLYISKWQGAMVISRILRKYIVDCYRYKLIPQEIEDAYFNLDLEEFNSLPSETARARYFLKKHNIKKVDDLMKNNVKGKKLTYEELNKMWEERFPNTNIVFCINENFENKEGNEFFIPEINFLDDNPIVKGSYKLTFNTWKYGGMLYNTEGRSLTWSDLLDILDEHNDKSHIFLESIDIKNNNEIFVFLGS